MGCDGIQIADQLWFDVFWSLFTWWVVVKAVRRTSCSGSICSVVSLGPFAKFFFPRGRPADSFSFYIVTLLSILFCGFAFPLPSGFCCQPDSFSLLVFETFPLPALFIECSFSALGSFCLFSVPLQQTFILFRFLLSLLFVLFFLLLLSLLTSSVFHHLPEASLHDVF